MARSPIVLTGRASVFDWTMTIRLQVIRILHYGITRAVACQGQTQTDKSRPSSVVALRNIVLQHREIATAFVQHENHIL